MQQLVVSIEEGQLRGKKSVDYLGGQFVSFLGIPYGKPPVGKLRFKAPEPAEPWTGIKDATKDGQPCPALDMYFSYYVGKEEDCLNLNVHTKELPSADNPKLKPVMFWIHGGAFLFGSNLNELFGPDFLMTEDIVMVSINYRLGVLGFLSLEDPSFQIPGNAGLKDMVLALKWVQKNISKFGGDPGNVTIFGESAGSASVHYLTLSPLCRGLFHKAICQSGCTLNCWAKAKSNSTEISNALGYNLTDERAILEKLLRESAKNIVYAQNKIEDTFTASSVRPFGPVVETVKSDGAFLVEEPLEILRSGNFAKIPIIIGFNTAEGMLYEIVRKTRPYCKLSKNLEIEIPYELNLPLGSEQSKEVADKIKKFYFQDREVDEDSINTTYLLKGDNQFMYGIYKTVLLQREHTTEPIYVYLMSLEGSLNFFKKFCEAKHLKTLFLCLFLSRMSAKCGVLRSLFHSLGNLIPAKPLEGVSHADDLGYLFKSFCTSKITVGSAEDTHIKRFVKMWTNFARCGNPTPEPDDDVLNKVTWSPVEKSEFHILDIGKDLRSVQFPYETRMQFWVDIFNQYAS